MTTVTATRTVPIDPASTALLLAGPSAIEFWPGVTRVDGVLSPLSAFAELAGDSQRRLVVCAQPPRRTATAYITAFSVDADGLPSASGILRVTGLDWIGGTVVPEQPDHAANVAASIQFELKSDVDFDAVVEREIAEAAHRFLDNVAAFAGGHSVRA